MDNRKKLEKFGLYDPRFEHDACGVGFVCDIKGRKSHLIVENGLEILRRLSHRGATGADPKTGDGAGLLIQMPHEFFKQVCLSEKITLPPLGEYGSGLIFLPRREKDNLLAKKIFSQQINKENLALLGWRKVPVDSVDIGKTARETQPEITQVFIGKGKAKGLEDILAWERKLYLVRKRIEIAAASCGLKEKSFYVTNLSSRTFIYKGLLMPEQLDKFFPDLKDPLIASCLCLVHSRYSTNTFPTWDLAQPFRYLAHNGEINTLRGNINWMSARQGLLKSPFFGKAIKELLPVIVPGGSDSAALDNVFELLVLSGRSLAQAMLMLIPAAWQQDKEMAEEVRNFYKYHACLMEPWDGPAAVAFTDGENIGAVLDRNGLRPARYLVTKNDLVIMASEVGVIDIKDQDIVVSGRLEPGKIFFIDTKAGRIIQDKEVKHNISSKKPYGNWLSQNQVDLESLLKEQKNQKEKIPPVKEIAAQLKAFGYTREDMKIILSPMAETAQEPVGSMGNDSPLAVFSLKPQLLYNYFKQLFAQVTNPAIDPIREELVMSLKTYLGPEGNLLDETNQHCHRLAVKTPVLSNQELQVLKKIRSQGFKTKLIPALFEVDDKKDFKKSINLICKEAEEAIKKGYTFILLSDRGTNKKFAAIPALLAVGAVHHHLIRKQLRTQISILVESAEPREVHHFALLFGYGADCINPYLAFDALRYLITEKEINLSQTDAEHNYVKAIVKGILKILSKMGISTLQSYRGAQIFEALGIDKDVIERYFTGTVSRIGGVTLESIAEETRMRHQQAFGEQGIINPELTSGGIYQWRRDGEFHLWNPESIASLQEAASNNDYKRYREFSRLINDQSGQPVTLRGAMKFKKLTPVPLEEVEPQEEILKRFVTGAMSFGSISKEAHESLALAMNRLGGKSNTGEGGEDPARFALLPDGSSKRSAIKQVASGRFGVTANYLVNADEIQIKISQGAKPGEGGQLPGHKVSAEIARIRYTTPGVTLISPPPHHDIYSIEDLAQLIFDLKNTNPAARISVKLVSEIGVGTVAAGVAKGHADMILISGGDGGTGASPLSSIKHAGLPWELGPAETHQTLVINNLRDRVRLQADGQMRTGKDVAIAACLGAEEYGFCTAALIVLGCVMLRHCHLNNCSVGVATQDEVLRCRFKGNAEILVNYFRFVAEELREIMAALGLRKLDDMIGRADLLILDKQILSWKNKGIDYSRIFYVPEVNGEIKTRYSRPQDHNITNVLDHSLIESVKDAIYQAKPVYIESKISNSDRSVGAMLSGKLCKQRKEEGLPADTIRIKFKGVAGQSFGAFLAKGITFELEGLANDYVGKGISGGKIIIYPARNINYNPEENILIGNTAFYGAICGEAYIQGKAGERFCIRNSGLCAVVEGLGDHGCEYMTGGRVVVLGNTGKNFAAGMSGGVAYIYNPKADFKEHCNLEMVGLEKLSSEDTVEVERLIRQHFRYTQSRLAKEFLDNFNLRINKFIKVMPIEYKRILEELSDG